MKIKRLTIKTTKYDVRCILLTILIYMYILFSICPQLIILNMAEIIKAVLLAGISTLIIICYNRLGKMNIFCLLYCLYIPVMSYMAGKATIGNRYISLMFLPLGGIVFDIYMRKGYISVLKKMLALIVPVVLYVYVQTFRALGSSPYAVRKIKTYDEYTIQMRNAGVGGYEFIYFLAMLAIVFWCLILLEKEIVKRAVAFIAFALSFILILRSNYLTAAITVAVGVAISITLFLVKKSPGWGGVIFLMAGLGLILHEIIINVSVNFLTKYIITSGKNYDRLLMLKEKGLESLIDILESEGRAELYGVSLTSVKENALLGLVFEENGSINNISQHSFILDTFALFGVVIGVATCIIILANFKKEYFKDEAIIMTISMLVATGIVLGGNNLTASIAIVVTLIYPCMVTKKERKNVDGNTAISGG